MVKKKPNGYWNFENCKEEALEYESRGDYQKFSLSPYVISRKKRLVR